MNVTGSVRRSCGWLLPLCFCACAATNYLDPTLPLYTGQYGKARLASTTDTLGARAIRVVSFNIAFAVEIDSALAVLQHEPALQQPDLLCLQEMDAPSTERIAAALGLNYVYFPSGMHPKHGRDFGCAILSPWPLQEPRKIVLPHAARITGLRRVATVATVRCGGQSLRVYAVHLPSPAGITGNQRREQVELLAADAGNSPDPVIIAGDFNSEDVGEIFVRAGYVWPTRSIGPTTRAYGVGFRYDHVFARGLRPAAGEVTVGVVTRNRAASDHYPIWVQLTLE
jgi:endonuclease/exonuclease/phosphatase family metal-dependent hydrolase